MLFKIQPVLEDSLTQWMNTPGTSAPITAAQGTSTANTPITTPATATNADKWQNANIIAQTSSSALNAFSSLTSARQQSSNLNANAQLLDQQANQAILNAGQQSALIRRRGAQFQGDQMRVLLQVVPALVARMRCCAGRPRLTSRRMRTR